VSSRHIVALALPFVLTLGSDRVVGSVPGGGESLSAVLEAQGEWRLAAASLAADASADTATVIARVRVAVRRRDSAAARSALAAAGAHVAPDAAALVGAALAWRDGDAATSLAALEAHPPPSGLEPWANLLVAETAAALGRWETASAAAARTGTAALPPDARWRWFLVQAQLAQAAGDAAALDRLLPELGDAARRDDRAGLRVCAMGRAAARGGDAARARALWLVALEARPAAAETAYAELRGAPPHPSLVLAMARYEMRSDRHDAARARLRSAIVAGLPATTRAEARLLVAESWLRSGDAAQCLKALDRAALDTRGTARDAERLRLSARALRMQGRRDDAIRAYRQLATRFPHHDKADDAVYEVGWLLENARRFADAEQAYLRAARAYPRGALADDALLRAGLCALRGRRPAEAAEHLASLMARHAQSSLMDNALYWQMLSQIDLGDAAGALVLRDRLERDFPRSYFTTLARRRIERGLAPAPLAASEPGPGVVLGGESELAAAWRVHAAWDSAVVTLRHSFGVPSVTFAAAARAWRFWLDWGFEAEAQAETRWLERRYDEDPAALLELAAGCHARGQHSRLVRLGWILSTKHADPERRAALEVLAYPAPYTPALGAAAAQHGLSHAALLGLMRQESAFDPNIDSAAGARGLMQIMPHVGRRLAAGAGVPGLHPDDLYDPEINMRLGCALLAEELRHAGGDLPQALAAYNAGGDRAATWQGRIGAGEPRELYVDLVEFSETRNYLKSVLGNAETYRRLYALP
jgi:soluble lytic murein transglycosylase